MTMFTRLKKKDQSMFEYAKHRGICLYQGGENVIARKQRQVV